MIQILNDGNIISPKGASIIFGAESTQDHLDIAVRNQSTYADPYSIVIVEEDTDETLPAEQISFQTEPTSAITSTNVQGAIRELEQITYANVPSLVQEVKQFTIAGQTSITLSKVYKPESTMVYYNGLLINNTIHYNLNGTSLSLIGFASETGDIVTVVGLASSGAGSNPADQAEIIGGAY